MVLTLAAREGTGDRTLRVRKDLGWNVRVKKMGFALSWTFPSVSAFVNKAALVNFYCAHVFTLPSCLPVSKFPPRIPLHLVVMSPQAALGGTVSQTAPVFYDLDGFEHWPSVL